MFATERIPVRLEKFGLGTRKKNGGTDEVVLKVGFGIQPFTIEMADELGVKSRLFTPNTGKPHDNVLGEKLALALQLQQIEIALAEDASAPSLVLVDGHIGPLTVRKDKEGPVYAASFTVTATLPEARDFLFLAERYTYQVYATFHAQQADLLPSPVDDEAEDDAAE